MVLRERFDDSAIVLFLPTPASSRAVKTKNEGDTCQKLQRLAAWAETEEGMAWVQMGMEDSTVGYPTPKTPTKEKLIVKARHRSSPACMKSNSTRGPPPTPQHCLKLPRRWSNCGNIVDGTIPAILEIGQDRNLLLLRLSSPDGSTDPANLAPMNVACQLPICPLHLTLCADSQASRNLVPHHHS